MVTRERGQLLLVGAALVALAIVASVTLLNSIYTPGNLGTTDATQEATAIEQSQEELVDGIDGLFVRMGTATNTSSGNTFDDVPFLNDSQLAAFDSNVSESLVPVYSSRLAERGTVVTAELSRANTLNGTAVVQQDNSTFTNESDDSNWEVMEVDHIVRTRLDITSRESSPASLVVNNTDTWRLNISTDNVTLYRSGGGERTICDSAAFRNAQTVQVDIVRTTGRVTLNGTEVGCGSFTVAPNVNFPGTIRFQNGDTVTGNYVITGVGTPSFSDGSAHPDAFTDRTINPAFNVTYISSSVTYDARFRLYNRTEP